MLDREQVQYVIDRGIRASDLLANPSFTWIVDDQTNLHLSAMVAAKPGDTDAITYHHAVQHAMTEIVSALQGYAQAGEAQQHVLAALSDDDPEDEQEDTL